MKIQSVKHTATYVFDFATFCCCFALLRINGDRFVLAFLSVF